jgi:cytochrome P450
VKSFRDLPELSGATWTGHMDELTRDRIAFFHRWNREIADYGRLRVFGYHIVFANTPALVREVLVEKAKFFEKSPILRTILHPVGGEGLFTSEGELWKRQRRLMAPLFQPNQLEGYAAAMGECAAQVLAEMRDGEELDVAQVTTRITMNIAGRTLFDADTLSEADELGHALQVALSWADWAITSMPLILQTRLRTRLDHWESPLPGPVDQLRRRIVAALLPPILGPTGRSRELRQAVRTLDAKVARMIADRRAQGLDRPDLLSRLLQAHDDDDGSRMTDRQVRDEVLTLFIAGHETTASGLAWALYLLARDPVAYAKAQAEADALPGPPGFADLPRLTYNLQVFKEALRLYPPVFFFGRQTSTEVEVGGYVIPARTVFMLSPYALQHRADLYPDPERFDPERFTPEAEEARPKLAYFPFSAGPRACIGNHFALMEAPIVLARMLRHARFELCTTEPIPPEPKTTLRPKGGVPMRVQLR